MRLLTSSPVCSIMFWAAGVFSRYVYLYILRRRVVEARCVRASMLVWLHVAVLVTIACLGQLELPRSVLH